jgi:hypothetical protein
MGEIDNARAQRAALESVAVRNAAGVERRYEALGTYLTAVLYDEEHQPRPAGKADTDADEETEPGSGTTR